jgi:hypothetical protein
MSASQNSLRLVFRDLLRLNEMQDAGCDGAEALGGHRARRLSYILKVRAV